MKNEPKLLSKMGQSFGSLPKTYSRMLRQRLDDPHDSITSLSFIQKSKSLYYGHIFVFSYKYVSKRKTSPTKFKPH